MESLKNVKCFLLDLDGTIYLGGRLIDGAVEFLRSIKEKNKKYCFITNNSSRSTEDYINKLNKIGITATAQEVLTSGYAAISCLNENYIGKSVYVMGTQSLKNEFLQNGIKLTENNPDIVVLGYDTELTYAKLCTACKYINKGALYIATHPDINCPSEDFPLPDAGSFIAMIEKSTGRKPDIIIGKPYNVLAGAVLKRFGLKGGEVAAVGDRLYTDILFGKNSGYVSVLVLSGETDKKMLESGGITPDIVADSVKELINKI